MKTENKNPNPKPRSSWQEALEVSKQTQQRIIDDPDYARHFFHEVMRPNASALAYTYNRTYGLNLTTADVAYTTYLACWNHNWARLRAYKGNTTIHDWVAKIGTQALHQKLIDENYIRPACHRASDYRLRLLSIDDPGLRQRIVSLVNHPTMQRALQLRYVDKADKATLTRQLGPDAPRWLKVAEKALIEQLLITDDPLAETALAPKYNTPDTRRLQDWHSGNSDDDDDQCLGQLRDTINDLIRGNDRDYDDKVTTLIRHIIAPLKWDKRDQDIWWQRFVNNAPPAELAQLYNVQRSYIDNTYSHLNRQFRIAARHWWQNI